MIPDLPFDEQAVEYMRARKDERERESESRTRKRKERREKEKEKRSCINLSESRFTAQ